MQSLCYVPALNSVFISAEESALTATNMPAYF